MVETEILFKVRWKKIEFYGIATPKTFSGYTAHLALVGVAQQLERQPAY